MIQKLLAEIHHSRWLSILKSLQESQKASSLLMLAPPGSGALEVIQTLYLRLHCERPEGDLPCWKCSRCERITGGRWPDYVVLQEEDGLGVDAIRELKSKAGFGPAEPGAEHWVVIPQAHLLTPQASNAFLKILEEPPRGWRLVLSTSDESLLLPTLTSRCVRVRLGPIPSEQMPALLKELGIPEARMAVAARLAHGNLDRAKLFASDDLWQKRDLFLKFLSAPQANYSSIIEWASSDSASLELLVDQLEGVTRDLLEWSCGEPLPTSDASAALQNVCKRALASQSEAHFREHLFKISDGLASQRRDLGIVLNRKLVAQNVLAPWVF